MNLCMKNENIILSLSLVKYMYMMEKNDGCNNWSRSKIEREREKYIKNKICNLQQEFVSQMFYIYILYICSI